MEPVIKFLGYSIEKLIYSKEALEFIEELDANNEQEMSLSLQQGITEDMKKAKLSLTLNLKDICKEIYISLQIIGNFEIMDIEDEEEINRFLAVNGTAIIYPYVRSVVSMISSLDANEAIILPTINTSSFADK